MDTSDLSHHIHSRYNADLEGIRTGVLQMGGLVEQQLQNGVKAIVGGDSRLGEEVARQDHKVNAMEVAIDEDCSRVLATRAPTEKLGHAAARLSKSDRTADRYRELKHIGELVADMVHGALDAFARLDTEAALSVARRDRVIDEEYEVLQRQCITFMMEDPRAIRRTLDILSLARALERVGDHAKNICEYVVYMVLGKDIRHLSIEDVERQIGAARASKQAEGG